MSTQTKESGSPAVLESIALMARLRAPDGCPWDREQTFDSIKRHTLEETYEVFDAIERRAWPDLKDELGDLLLQVLFYAQMAQDAGYFNFEDVAANLNAKLVRRHPHIFGDATADDAEAVKVTWEAVKRQEKAARGADGAKGLLDEVPRSMPAMLEAGKLGSKAAKVGFDWPDAAGLFEKLDEEIEELKAELVALPGMSGREPQSPRGEAGHAAGSPDGAFEELGDLLFTAVNLSRHLKLDPEFALRAANAKFRRRFGAMEAAAGGAAELERLGPAELESLWAKAKAVER